MCAPRLFPTPNLNPPCPPSISSTMLQLEEMKAIKAAQAEGGDAAAAAVVAALRSGVSVASASEDAARAAPPV